MRSGNTVITMLKIPFAVQGSQSTAAIIMSYIKTSRGLDVCLESVDANQVVCETSEHMVSGSRSTGVLCTSRETSVLTLCVTDFCQGLCILLHYASMPSLHLVNVLDIAQPSPSAADSSCFCRLSADCCKLLASFLSALTAMFTSLPADYLKTT